MEPFNYGGDEGHTKVAFGTCPAYPAQQCAHGMLH